MQTTTLYARDVTPIPPLALILFGGSLATETQNQNRDASTLTVDGWIKLTLPPFVRSQLLAIRQRLDALFDGWVTGRGQRDQQEDELMKKGGAELLKAIVELLSAQEEIAPPSHPSAQGHSSKSSKWKKR